MGISGGMKSIARKSSLKILAKTNLLIGMISERNSKRSSLPHMDSLAINHLESTAYYQKGWSLDKYLDEFQDLIMDSSYMDPKSILVKF